MEVMCYEVDALFITKKHMNTSIVVILLIIEKIDVGKYTKRREENEKV